MIEEMDKGMDKNMKVMEKVRGKMTKIMVETSNCCLIILIVIETLVMTAMLIYL